MRLSAEDKSTIEGLRKDLAETRTALREARDERDEALSAVKLADQVTDLKEKLADLQIQESRVEERHQREKREVEHATGLLRMQVEWEQEKAVGEATLAVREENLSAQQTRFEEQMQFHRDQIAGEIARLDDLLKGLMERLPTISLEGSLTGSNGHS